MRCMGADIWAHLRISAVGFERGFGHFLNICAGYEQTLMSTLWTGSRTRYVATRAASWVRPFTPSHTNST